MFIYRFFTLYINNNNNKNNAIYISNLIRFINNLLIVELLKQCTVVLGCCCCCCYFQIFISISRFYFQYFLIFVIVFFVIIFFSVQIHTYLNKYTFGRDRIPVSQTIGMFSLLKVIPLLAQQLRRKQIWCVLSIILRYQLRRIIFNYNKNSI